MCAHLTAIHTQASKLHLRAHTCMKAWHTLTHARKTRLWSNQPLNTANDYGYLSITACWLRETVISSKIHTIRLHHGTGHGMAKSCFTVNCWWRQCHVFLIVTTELYMQNPDSIQFHPPSSIRWSSGKVYKRLWPLGEQDETAGIKCKAHFELGLIRGKWLLIAWAARSYDDLKTAGGMSVLSPLNIRALLVSLVVWRVRRIGGCTATS